MTKELLKIIKEEGDEMDFEIFSLKARIIRNKKLGIWCGYVQVPEESILYGADFPSFFNEKKTTKIQKEILNIEVHGGLSFAGEVDNDKSWWFGFDCGHYRDYVPYLPSLGGKLYRDKNYVIGECKKLASQLLRITKEYDPKRL